MMVSLEYNSLHTSLNVESLGSWQEIIPQDCAGSGFVYKAHPAAQVKIHVGGCNAVVDPKDRQMWNYFSLRPLDPCRDPKIKNDRVAKTTVRENAR